jgi:outer membrane protein assembly factor BamB
MRLPAAQAMIGRVFLAILVAAVAASVSAEAAMRAPEVARRTLASQPVGIRPSRPASGYVNWAQLGFDVGHSGVNPFERAISTKNVGQLQQAWLFSLGSGNALGNPIEANNVVYAPSLQGTLFALNGSTGQLLWSFASGTGYASSGSSPAYDNGALFVVCNTSASTQGICALNATDGTPLWSYTFPGSVAYDGTPPMVAEGKVFFEGCAASCSYLGLDQASGNVVFEVDEPQGACEGNGGIAPSVVLKLLFVEYTCPGTLGQLLAIGTKNNKPKWIVTNAPQNAGLTVALGLLAVVFQGGSPVSQTLNLFLAKKGALRWQNKDGPWYATSPSMPAITKSNIYVTRNHELAAFSTSHGALTWRSFPAVSTSSPSVANGVIYTACRGKPCAYDAASGLPLWSGGGAQTTGAPIVANGTLYGGCEGNNICAWTLPSSMRLRLRSRE